MIQPQRVALTTELPGRTSACLIAEVRPQVGGIIQKRLFTEGADVKAGEVLYQIDPATYQAAYNSAKAAFARAEANLIPARLKAGRYQELVKINAVSQQDYDDASAALKLAEADLEAGKAALETARINLAYTKVTAPISGRIGRSSVTNGALCNRKSACCAGHHPGAQFHICGCHAVQLRNAAPESEPRQRLAQEQRCGPGKSETAS